MHTSAVVDLAYQRRSNTIRVWALKLKVLCDATMYVKYILLLCAEHLAPQTSSSSTPLEMGYLRDVQSLVRLLAGPIDPSCTAGAIADKLTSDSWFFCERRSIRCRKVGARCRFEGCSGRPWFAQPGSRVPKACKAHKEEGEVNVYAPACEADGCATRPHYGVDGGRARFCCNHKVCSCLFLGVFVFVVEGRISIRYSTAWVWCGIVKAFCQLCNHEERQRGRPG